MSEVYTVKVCKPDGTVVWAGVVPVEDVVIDHPPNAPATCTIQTRMLDALQYLMVRPTDSPFPQPALESSEKGLWRDREIPAQPADVPMVRE